MEEILGNIYCWFESLFGEYLAEHLWGYNCSTLDYSNINIFNSVGVLTLAVSLVFVVMYYYLPIFGFNHPRSNRWWNWLIILLISGIINLFIAYGWTVNDLLNGNIGDCLMYVRDAEGNIVSQLISEKNCWLFGLANFFVSSIFFLGLTFIMKWWSRNCKHSPI